MNIEEQLDKLSGQDKDQQAQRAALRSARHAAATRAVNSRIHRTQLPILAVSWLYLMHAFPAGSASLGVLALLIASGVGNSFRLDRRVADLEFGGSARQTYIDGAISAAVAFFVALLVALISNHLPGSGQACNATGWCYPPYWSWYSSAARSSTQPVAEWLMPSLLAWAWMREMLGDRAKLETRAEAAIQSLQQTEQED